jgi:ABC-2 type transport system ATP-binding protein
MSSAAGDRPAGGPAPGAPPSPLIELTGLVRRFRDLVAVDGLSFAVEEGELFGLVGPDGAGKTTTLRMLAGVLRPSAGDIHIGGVSVVRDPERVKPGIAYMAQRFGLYADLTVDENLTFYADLYGVPRRDREGRLERLFAFSGLGPFRNRLAGQLSGGMKQKLGLSCALVHRPQVLLLDEPTFGVDPISRRDLWLIVHEMVAEGVTTVVSTAYLDEAERFDRLALLHEGRTLALDTPAALQRAMPGELVALDVEPARAAYAAAKEHPAVRRAAVFGHELHLTVDSWERDRAAIEEHLARAGLAVRASRRIEPSLEDVLIDRIAAEGQGRAATVAGNP